MLIMISSGAQRRYADDIVRAMAHPRGTSFQFRYGTQYIDPALHGRIAANELVDEHAIICYLSSDSNALTTSLIPCRFVSIRATQLLGTSCIFTLEAGAFVNNFSDQGLRHRLSTTERTMIPAFVATTRKIEGSFAFETKAELAADGRVASAAADDIAAFEQTAAALSADAQFGSGSKRAFFTVRQIATTDRWFWAWWSATPKAVAPKSGRYKLKSGLRYFADVYTYSPTGGAVTAGSTKLAIDSDEKDVRFTSGKMIVLDSRYDLHRFSFATDQRVIGVPAGLRVALSVPTDADPKTSEQRCDIMLETRFAGSLWLGVARIIVIGIGTATPAIIAASKSAAPGDKLTLGTIAAMIVGGCVAGLGTVIPSLKKS